MAMAMVDTEVIDEDGVTTGKSNGRIISYKDDETYFWNNDHLLP